MEQKVYDFIRISQQNHWWFSGRKKIIDRILNFYNPKKIKNALDIGSGYGSMVPILLRYCENVDAIEPHANAKEHLLNLGIKTVFSISSFPDHSINYQYNLITLFDVLEHIKNHEKALLIIKEMLIKPGGRLILTVPAYMWLWSSHDKLNHHFRRYTKKNLIDLLNMSGYKNVKVTYFMTFLFPFAVLQRFRIKWNKNLEEFQSIHPLLNFVLKFVFSTESYLIHFFPFPFGLSVLAVAEN